MLVVLFFDGELTVFSQTPCMSIAICLGKQSMSIDIRCYFLLEALQLSTALGSERMTYKSRKVDVDVSFYVHARVYVPSQNSRRWA